MKKAYNGEVWHMAESIWDSYMSNRIGGKHFDQLTENDEERVVVTGLLELASETLTKLNGLTHVKK